MHVDGCEEQTHGLRLTKHVLLATYMPPGHQLYFNDLSGLDSVHFSTQVSVPICKAGIIHALYSMVAVNPSDNSAKCQHRAL